MAAEALPQLLGSGRLAADELVQAQVGQEGSHLAGVIFTQRLKFNPRAPQRGRVRPRVRVHDAHGRRRPAPGSRSRILYGTPTPALNAAE